MVCVAPDLLAPDLLAPPYRLLGQVRVGPRWCRFSLDFDIENMDSGLSKKIHAPRTRETLTEQLEQMVRNANILSLLLSAGTLVLAGCADSTAVGGGEDDSPSDLPQPEPDLPDQATQWEGVLNAVVFDSLPSQFTLCDSGEVVQIAFAADPSQPWSGSCTGVYHRFEGMLNRELDPPLLVVDEILDARWCSEASCNSPDTGGDCSPDFSSCYAENDIAGGCDPMIGGGIGGGLGCGSDACRPARFYVTEATDATEATQSAGWMHHSCVAAGAGEAGAACSYPEAGAQTGRVDSCAHGYRCWNIDGDLGSPGVCVAYCDPAGLEGPACAGSCVPCSSSGRGLCVSGCSGAACAVAEFC